MLRLNSSSDFLLRVLRALRGLYLRAKLKSQKSQMLLIFPPIVKPCEPPPGVALLSGALKEQGFPCKVIDANIEGILYLIRSDKSRKLEKMDAWSKRAIKNREQMLRDFKEPFLYTNDSRYHQRVYDLNRLLSISADHDQGQGQGQNRARFRLSLSDYSDKLLSPLKSRDLMQSAREYRDNPFYPYFEECLRPILKSGLKNSDADFVGVSLCYLNQALTAFALAGWIKDNFKEKQIIMGGGLISSWMSHPDYSHPFKGLVDLCIRGEGEVALLKLLSKKPLSKKHYIPDYDFVKKDIYLAPGLVLPFRASIGCYWSKCSFCPEKAEKSHYKVQKIAEVLENLKILDRKYQPDYVHFIDNAVPPAFLRAMSLEKFSFKWYGFIRFEKDLLSLDYCKSLKAAGCDMLKLGLESGDPTVLARMNKGTDLAIASRILENLHKAGILTYVYLLFGTIYEDETAAFRTLDFVKAHEKFIDYLNLAIFNLPRFSEDAGEVETTQFYDGDLSLYMDFKHPLGWDRRKIKHFISRIFKKELTNGTNGGHIQRTPAFFSSNHAAFF
jgi:radical SAM superfamily enzyme YgiQ (UPF0313 family)